MSDGFLSVLIYIVAVVVVVGATGLIVWLQYKRIIREAKNYERGLKMVPLHIHLPPSSMDLNNEQRDQRDVTDEVISQAQVMYNIIASTATKGFKAAINGQRHISFELISEGGIIYYYVVVPVVLLDVVRQAIWTAYPSVIIEEVRGENIFNQVGKTTGTIGGEFTLKKDFIYPIATYQDNKQDASRSILNALSLASKEDGVAIQILLRPANEKWLNASADSVKKIQKNKTTAKKKMFFAAADVLEALWKPPEIREKTEEGRQLTSLEQAEIEAIEGKSRYPGFETLVRVVVSSNTVNQAKTILQNIVSAFSLFNSPHYNGFKFLPTKNIDALITSYIMRFFPQELSSNILNSVELSTIYHLPTQKDIPTSQVRRQTSKEVDGPTEVATEGLLLGYNEFRGVRKPIRLSTNDRRRHTYFIGQTGTGKSGLLENLAYQDMMSGRGFAFIDPHGDSAEKILGMVPRDRVEDVVYFNPSDLDNPIGLNLFEFESEDQRDFLIQEGIQMLYRLYDPGHTGIVGPRFEHWFRNAALTIMADPDGSTFIDIPQVFNDQAFADYKLKYVKDQTVLDFWNKEMAQTTESSKSDVLGWFASKFGAFLSNEMMRNIIGQTKSGFNIREIMDNNKILIVNLSKGKTGELNSMLLGMIFVMKFQVAAMSRANIPEKDRNDFCLYVDEFQNFATDSFESILSEARKYRLNVIVANQFMTQLTDKIREAIIGNVGTIISGRVGITDAEVLQKRFAPEFDIEDITKLPNYHTISSVLINNVPSPPFSMTLIPPMGKSNPQLAEALKKLSNSKYALPKEAVNKQIMERLSAGDRLRSRQLEQAERSSNARFMSHGGTSSGFLDEWLDKRRQLKAAANDNSNNVVNGIGSQKTATGGFLNNTKMTENVSLEGDNQSNSTQSETPRAIDFRNQSQNSSSMETTINLR